MENWYDYNFSGRRILLVEDNEINTFMEQRLLETLGFQVVTAEDGKLGVEMYQTYGAGYFDAILMDINMPVMNGWVAAQRIRELEQSGELQIPIIAVTTNGYAEDMCKSKEAGMNEHLVKPIEPIKLCRCLAQYLY